MKFTGKELFVLGVPQNKIKLFVGREFDSVDELKAELAPKEIVATEKVFTWIDWIVQTHPMTHLPMMFQGELPVVMSKSELKRIFDSKSVEINGKFPSSTEECKEEDFPIKSWVWFPKSKSGNGKKSRKTTWA